MSKTRKTRVVLADELRHMAAHEYRNARRDEKIRVLRKYQVSRGAMSGWLGKGYGLQAPRITSAGRERIEVIERGMTQPREHGRFVASGAPAPASTGDVPIAKGTRELDRAGVRLSMSAERLRHAVLEALAEQAIDLKTAEETLARLYPETRADGNGEGDEPREQPRPRART